MSKEKIDDKAFNNITLQPNKTMVEDYLQSKTCYQTQTLPITFLSPPKPHSGWGNYKEFAEEKNNKSVNEMGTGRVFNK